MEQVWAGVMYTIFIGMHNFIKSWFAPLGASSQQQNTMPGPCLVGHENKTGHLRMRPARMIHSGQISASLCGVSLNLKYVNLESLNKSAVKYGINWNHFRFWPLDTLTPIPSLKDLTVLALRKVFLPSSFAGYSLQLSFSQSSIDSSLYI